MAANRVMAKLGATHQAKWPPFTTSVSLSSVAKGLNHQPETASGKISIYFFTCLLFETKKKRGFFLCFTPPENEFGNQLFFFWILGSSSTFRLFHSYESKKVDHVVDWDGSKYA